MEFKTRILEDALLQEKEYKVTCMICDAEHKVKSKIPPTFVMCEECKKDPNKFWLKNNG